MDDRQPFFGRQCLSLPNFFVAEDTVHYSPNFVTMWNPPFYMQGLRTHRVLRSWLVFYYAYPVHTFWWGKYNLIEGSIRQTKALQHYIHLSYCHF